MTQISIFKVGVYHSSPFWICLTTRNHYRSHLSWTVYEVQLVTGKQLAQSGSTVLISTPVSRSHRTPVLTLNLTPTITLEDINATPSHKFIPSNRTDAQRPVDTSISDTTDGILEVPSNGTDPSVFSTRMEHSCITDVLSNTDNRHTHDKFMKNGPPRDIPQSPPDPTIPTLNCEELYDAIDHQGCTHAWLLWIWRRLSTYFFQNLRLTRRLGPYWRCRVLEHRESPKIGTPKPVTIYLAHGPTELHALNSML